MPFQLHARIMLRTSLKPPSQHHKNLARTSPALPPHNNENMLAIALDKNVQSYCFGKYGLDGARALENNALELTSPRRNRTETSDCVKPGSIAILNNKPTSAHSKKSDEPLHYNVAMPYSIQASVIMNERACRFRSKWCCNVWSASFRVSETA